MNSLRLSESLTECSELLQSVGETFWSGKIEAVLAQGISDYCARGILEWYGGMGSFSDLMICRINGHDVRSEDEPEINQKLSVLRTMIYEEADALNKG